MKKLYLSIIAFISFYSVQAQQEAMYSQYLFNPLAINPAMSSKTNEATTKIIYRKKFMGGDFEGDPQTQTVVVDLPLANEKMNLGIQLYNDIAGIIKSTGGYGIYSYKAQFNDELSLTMGIQAGITNYRANLTSVQLIDPKDPNFGQNINKILPSVGTGINLSNEKWFLAISVPQIIRTNLSLVENPNANYSTANSRFLFAMFGYDFRINKSIKISPNILAKVVENAPVAFDYNLKASFNDKFTLGGSLRTANAKFNEVSTQTRLGDAFLAFTEVQITPKIRFGYAYNISTTKGQYDSGSHEIMLSFRFLKSQEETVVDPRFK
ncbi:type IX secretion system PorP/SprF family membrane protein [Arcicella aurantiaca]|uniref:Type IX secretion system PorP/SprF family membrane protein n=1 Tax=Arcicella aurantiaca TaxID=591202 RepID=A0A316E953_9BACT|nr:type IX secretion system membrane protein PorP/SprF [Arcicella aurantiaca]PWK26899.1 type IX secretion system PorP/SprF family membrane protein [Arcicella aurantiaca]